MHLKLKNLIQNSDIEKKKRDLEGKKLIWEKNRTGTPEKGEDFFCLSI